MNKLPTNLECFEATADDISTDNSSNRSSFVSSESPEERISVSEGSDGNFGRESVVSVSDEEVLGERRPAEQAMEADLLMRRNFRSDYIHKLTSMKTVQQSTRKPHQTIAIFDWDDTLFPTTFLSAIGFDKVQSEMKVQHVLSKIDKCVYKLLQKALRVGKTYIVTNAMKNWVETSSEMYLPLTYGLIRKNEITVVSARAKYEKSHPNDPKRWKQEAFLDIKSSLESSVFTNLICAGDSTIELEAAQHVSKGLEHAILKTIKFKEGPSLEELSKQLETVVEKFDQIYLTLKNLAIKVERKN